MTVAINSPIKRACSEPLQNPPTIMTMLPEELRQMIFGQAGNPRFSETCREWHVYREGFFAQLCVNFEHSRLIQPFIPPIGAPLTDQEQVSGVINTIARIRLFYNDWREKGSVEFSQYSFDAATLERVISLSKQCEIDLNLIQFYQILRLSVPLPELPNLPTFAEQANHIRYWFENNQSLLSQITVLKLNGLSLKTVPSEIRYLVNLEKLNLSDNELVSLPIEISQLARLFEIKLKNNRFITFADDLRRLANLPSLTILVLSDNQFSDLPAEIGLLRNLIWLDLSNNALRDLPQALNQLDRLHLLDLSSNPVDIDHIRDRLEQHIPDCLILFNPPEEAAEA